MQPLTERQQAILEYIQQAIDEKGYPPTLREIGARMDIRSTNGVSDHLRALADKIDKAVERGKSDLSQNKIEKGEP